MAKGNQVRALNKHKKLERRRRREKRGRQDPSPPVRESRYKLAEQIDEAYDLINSRKFAEAEELLEGINQRYDRFPEVHEVRLCLYQTTMNHERSCVAARQLSRLKPRDVEARMLYAQSSLLCGRIGIALTNYQFVLKHWPADECAEKAENVIELIEPQVEARIQSLAFGDLGSDTARLDALVMHDEVLEYIQRGEFADAARKCLELLKLAPDCISARNNLALSYFQSGQIEKSIQVAEETRRLAPNNRFAEAAFGKLLFLSGDADEANAIADAIVVNPPVDMDSLGIAMELLGFLGRDEDVVVLYAAVEAPRKLDPRCQSVLLHHLAVAQFRLGDQRAARTSWKKCLRAMPHPDAQENLGDLDAGDGHAAWYAPAVKWIPQPVFEKICGKSGSLRENGSLNLADDYPEIAALIPGLLDRGDPIGREMAVSLAAVDGSPAMLDALLQFALGSRGPDKLRYKTLNILVREGRVDNGPHRFYSGGKWLEITLCMPEIHWEAKDSSPWEQDLSEAGIEALNLRDFSLAESIFNTILQKQPDNCPAAYNLCMVWLLRDGESGRRRAEARLEEIAQKFPDYLFARISLAQFAAIDKDFELAWKLLEPVFDQKRLHVSEAKALFAAQIQILIGRRDFDSAERILLVLTQIADEDDPNVAQLRRRIDSASRANRLRKLFSRA